MLGIIGSAALAACTSTIFPQTDGTDPSTLAITLVEVANGLESPVYATSPIADPRLFVVEQPGRIRVLRGASLLPEPFLDISDRVWFEGERGLLGLAFDPDFRASGRFFVNYTDLDGNTRIEVYLDVDRGDRADPGSDMLFLTVAQPFPNHNGGQLEFGPDNMLYIGLGDGGSAGDPIGHGQDASTLLGTILRVAVLDQLGPPYRIPADNPFVGDPTRRPEICNYGLRNPWRFSFDTGRGFMFIGDVGQNRWKEINVVPFGDGGENFGWNILEGTECYAADSCDAENTRLPVAVYGHGDGCSVTGGYTYSGSEITALRGRYIYSDYCAGWLRTFQLSANGTAGDPVELDVPSPGSVTSLGQDADGELYVLTAGGRVLRIAAGNQP